MRDILRLLRLYRPYRRWMAGGIAISCVVILSNVALMAVSGWFIAAMALAGLGLLKVEFFMPAAAIRGLAILRAVGRYLERLVTHDATLRMLSELRVWFYRRLEPLAPARLQDFREGDLLARLRADIDSLDNFYLKILAPAVAGAITAVLIVGWLGFTDLRVAALDAAALIVAGVLVPLGSLAIGRGAGRRSVVSRARMQAAVTDLCRGIGELRIAGATGRQVARVMALSDRLMADQRRQAWIGAAGDTLSGFSGQIAMWLMLWLMIPTVGAGRLPGPDLVMLALAFMASTESVATLPGAFAAWGATAAAARRIFALADMPPAVTPPAEPKAPSGHAIAFRDVSMRYGDAGPEVLHDLSFTVPEGRCLALVGPSGAGKTTVLNLLQRFWPVRAGEVSIGGVSVLDIGEEALRETISVVGQRSHLFNATIRENLLLARPDASEEALWQALDAAGLSGELRDFPHGLDTEVGELGVALSGGQARRVALARAFLKDAPVLLLDEPTEGLDAKTEALVLDALSRLIRGRTTILVSHRPAALRLAGERLIFG